MDRVYTIDEVCKIITILQEIHINEFDVRDTKLGFKPYLEKLCETFKDNVTTKHRTLMYRACIHAKFASDDYALLNKVDNMDKKINSVSNYIRFEIKLFKKNKKGEDDLERSVTCRNISDLIYWVFTYKNETKNKNNHYIKVETSIFNKNGIVLVTSNDVFSCKMK